MRDGVRVYASMPTIAQSQRDTYSFLDSSPSLRNHDLLHPLLDKEMGGPFARCIERQSYWHMRSCSCQSGAFFGVLLATQVNQGKICACDR